MTQQQIPDTVVDLTEERIHDFDTDIRTAMEHYQTSRASVIELVEQINALTSQMNNLIDYLAEDGHTDCLRYRRDPLSLDTSDVDAAYSVTDAELFAWIDASLQYTDESLFSDVAMTATESGKPIRVVLSERAKEAGLTIREIISKES